MIPPEVASGISRALGRTFSPERATAISGGSICRAFRLEDANSRFFVKLGMRPFDSEIAALEEIAASKTLRVPTVLAKGESGDSLYWLALEYLELGEAGNSALLGEQLAAMHRHVAPRYGWGRDNHIGFTVQKNAASGDWLDFWRNRRLAPQLEQAAGQDAKLDDKGQRLLEALPHFLQGHRPSPALLHGDLWSGNVGFVAGGIPVVYDPASYYGDREADLAMTELFGGFDSGFYSAYRASFPLDPGYSARKVLYNLYHVLNHFNLFGGSYLGQARTMIERLLAEI